MGTSLTVRDPDQVKIWGERISQCRESGESVTQWCEENGIGIKSYYYWHNKLRKLSDEYNRGRESRFFDISESVCGSGSIAANIHIGNSNAEIYNGADKATIEAVIRAMQSQQKLHRFCIPHKMLCSQSSDCASFPLHLSEQIIYRHTHV